MHGTCTHEKTIAILNLPELAFCEASTQKTLKNYPRYTLKKLFVLNDYICCYETPTFLAAESISLSDIKVL